MKTLLLTSVCLLAITATRADLTNGLVAWYPLNGNTDDASGNGRSLANMGAVLTSNRFNQPNSAYFFDGISSIMIETNSADPLVLGSNWTLSCWVNLRTNTVNYSLIRHDGDASMVIVNYGHPAKTFYVEALNLNGMGYTSYAPAPPLNQWCMLTATWEGTNFEEYSNGHRQATTQASSTNSSATTNRICLGDSTIYQQPLLGALSDVRIYNRALSEWEIQQLYQYASGPTVTLLKAVEPSFFNLSVGTNYQLQVSTDLINWTNQGVAFSATNTSIVYPQYWNVDDWAQLFFRLQVVP